MSRSQNCVAVIPCHNESRRIGSLVTEVKRFVANVLVVDDGSSDGTAEEARRAGADVVVHGTRTGKGRSLMDGWQAARDAGFEWAITLDGDGQHAPGNIPRFLQKAQETGAPLVIGNRMDDPRGMPPLRRRVNHRLSCWISGLVGRSLPDTQCGYRLLHLPTLLEVPVAADHFEIESETVFQFALRRLAVEFVPIEVIYATETSKIRPLKDTVRWLFWYAGARRQALAMRGASALAANRRTRVPCSIQAL
jgi:glycosyltransferase involved in cell wall biosynthesis